MFEGGAVSYANELKKHSLYITCALPGACELSRADRAASLKGGASVPAEPGSRAAAMVLGQRNDVIDWNIWCSEDNINLMRLRRIRFIERNLKYNINSYLKKKSTLRSLCGSVVKDPPHPPTADMTLVICEWGFHALSSSFKMATSLIAAFVWPRWV